MSCRWRYQLAAWSAKIHWLASSLERAHGRRWHARPGQRLPGEPRVACERRGRPAPILGLELVRARSGRAEADDELAVAAGLLHAAVLQDHKAGGCRVLRTLS